MKITAKRLQKFKKENEKITMLTAYDYSTAKIFDEAGVDSILIGDSVGQVILGYDSTIHVTMEEMKIFTKAVSKGVKNAFIVSDMPYLSYQADISSAILNAGELIKSGADAVKIEGLSPFTDKVTERMIEAGIPVVGHLGFTPQFIKSIGGNFVQGKTYECAKEILEKAKRLEELGVCAIVLEMVPYEVASLITKNLNIPTIGIGSGNCCDGQVLVSEDILGKFKDFCPKFARKYANLSEIISESAKNYIKDVKTSDFPNESESFRLDEREREKIENYKYN